MSEADLLWRWIEDPAALDGEELAELKGALAADPALAARARRHLHLAARLGALTQPAVGSRAARAPRITPRLRTRWVVAAAAAALLVTLGLSFARFGDPIVGHLVDGRQVRVGDVVVADAARRELRLQTGDAMILDPGCSLRIVAADAKRVRLDLAGGSLTAEVAPRPTPGFAIVTPHATAMALGTRFHVQTDAGGSELSVERGRVAWSSSTVSLEVFAGRAAFIAVGGQPTLRPPERRWDFEDRIRPAAIMAGTIADDPERGPCLRGERYHEPTNSLGMFASDASGLTRLSAGTSLSFRYRIENGEETSLYIWAQTADDAQWRLRMEPGPGAGWHQRSVRLGSLEAIDDPGRHPPEGAIVLHLTIGINDGIGRAIYLDDIVMSEP